MKRASQSSARNNKRARRAAIPAGKPATKTPPSAKLWLSSNAASDPSIDHDHPVLFYGQKNPYAEFSQFYPCRFVVSKAKIAAVVGGTVEGCKTDDAGEDGTLPFTCAEQFMMFCKAVRFGDVSCQRRILAETVPKNMKHIGRQVAGFTDESWDMVKLAVVQLGSEAKFSSQNPTLQETLVATGRRLLVEAAPRDRVWGIGFGAANAPAQRERWGRNLLGVVLMRVRAKLPREGDEGVEGQDKDEDEEDENGKAKEKQRLQEQEP